jgi:peptidoglycan/xylan/chitin deacetylase (PgdA/CDA1 family)
MKLRRDILVIAGVVVAAVTIVVLVAGSMVSLTRDTEGGTGDDPVRVALADLPDAPPTQVPVLCYHYVRGPGNPLHLARVFGYVVLSLPLLDDSEYWRVGDRNFERQMEYLVSRGYETVTLEDLHEWQLGRRMLPPRPVVITFDDADESVYEYAFPVLRRYGLRASVFVVTGRVGQHWNGVRCLDWARLREMQQSGVFDIQSHSHDLHYKVETGAGMMPVLLAASEHDAAIDGDQRWEDVAFADLSRSRAEIQRHIGRTPEFLAWPYGFGNPALDQLAMEAGYLRTCSLRALPNTALAAGGKLLVTDTERYEIPRYTVTARTSLRAFRAMLEGTFRPET